MALSDYKYRRASVEPSVGGATTRDFKAVEKFVIAPDSLAQLWTFIAELLGSTNTSPTPGLYRLKRTVPVASARFPSLVANAIATIEGRGQPTRVPATPVPWGIELGDSPNQLPFADLYPEYELTVEFGNLAYPVVSDSKIVVEEGAYFYNTAAGVATSGVTKFTNEFQRYTRWTEKPLDGSVLNARLGAYKFAGGTVPGNPEVAAPVRRYLPDSVIEFTWFAVPIRYIDSQYSWIRRLRGFINQDFFCGRWPAGSLLYDSYDVVDYMPPLPLRNPFSTYAFGGPKLVDITFRFLSTMRTPAAVLTPNRPNYLAQGWNLFPTYSVPGWHYITSDGTVNGHPLFDSHPFKRLFNDPEVDQVL